MFQRALSVLFFIFLYGVGNAEQLPPSSRPNVSQSQESEFSKTPEVDNFVVVKNDVLAPGRPKERDVKSLDNPKENPGDTPENKVSPLASLTSGITPAAALALETAPTAPPSVLTPVSAPGLPPQVPNPPLATASAPLQKPCVPTVELLPHRATYSITLDKNYYDQDIAEAKGQMTIQLAKVGDGWSIEQKSTLHIYYKDETAEQVITTLATYESLDGLKYNFNARTVRGDQEDTISGEAILASKGGAGIVTYQEPDESSIQLPIGTIFPTQHLIYMLEAAFRGQKVVSNIVFDGSSETHEPVLVDTFLGAGTEPKLALTNKDLLQSRKVWPMRMAIYAVDSNGPEADYEICQHVLDHGVIRDMTLDYGTFKVKAVLNQVEVFS
ncbi:MAG: DUF1849 family protein [Alphaproteobacteria bacterium]|jgi:hypothetical protein|nr:DUF1849 family protein [Alphaproteobacteria bacterium]